MAPNFAAAGGSDSSVDLIMMWRAARDGWVPPTEISREQYAELRHAEPSALRGFVGFGCSFGGKWFGGYAANSAGKNYAAAASRSVVRKAATMGGAALGHRDYRLWLPGPSHLVYCDPPYAGTTAYKGQDPWNADEFWSTVGRWADRGALVFVSEYDAPAGWVPVWEREVKVSLEKSTNSGQAVERLYMRP
jgi:DNA adenine methylase